MSEIIDHDFRVFSDDNYDCDYEFISSSDNLKRDENNGHHKPLNSATRNAASGASRRKDKNSSTSQNRHLLGVRARKHPRDSDSKNFTEERKSENARIVIRKTLEVDDPIEAANSSIRTTLDNNNNNNNRRLHTSMSKAGGFFRGVQQHNNDHEYHEGRHNPIDEVSSTVLEFNPAAFSRSLLFHEISR